MLKVNRVGEDEIEVGGVAYVRNEELWRTMLDTAWGELVRSVWVAKNTGLNAAGSGAYLTGNLDTNRLEETDDHILHVFGAHIIEMLTGRLIRFESNGSAITTTKITGSLYESPTN